MLFLDILTYRLFIHFCHSLCVCFCETLLWVFPPLSIWTRICVSVPKFPLRVSLCVQISPSVSPYVSTALYPTSSPFPAKASPGLWIVTTPTSPQMPTSSSSRGVSTQKCFYKLLSARLRIVKILLTNCLIESNGRIREPWVWKNWEVLRSVKRLSNRALGKLKAKLTFIPLSNKTTIQFNFSRCHLYYLTTHDQECWKKKTKICLQQLQKTKHAICWKYLAENAILSSVELDAEPRPSSWIP